jgi:hypothetical protein
MKLVGITCIKNEADIIEPFLRHNLRYLDAMLVMDDNSSDQTLPIISRLITEGLPVHLCPIISPDAYRQSEISTQLMREAAKHHRADWVFVLDADEFIGAPSGRLKMPPPEGAHPVRLPWKTYCAQKTDDASEANPVLRIVHRLKNEPVDSKIAIPGPLAKDPAAMVAPGNHFLMLRDRRIQDEAISDLWLAHFPVRSFAQYCVKISTKRLRYLSEATGAFNQGRQYINLYEELCHAPAEAEKNWLSRLPPPYSELTEKEFVRNPFPYAGGPLLYTKPSSDILGFLASFLPLCESMARRIASQPAGPEAQQVIVRVLDRDGKVLASHVSPLAPGKSCRIPLPLSSPLSAPGARVVIEAPPCLFSIKSIGLTRENSSTAFSYSGPQVKEILRPDEGSFCPDFLEGLYFLKITKPGVLRLSGRPIGAPIQSICLTLNMESDFLSLNDLSIITPLVLSHGALEKRYRAGRYSLLGRIGHSIYRVRLRLRRTWMERIKIFRQPSPRIEKAPLA